MKKTIISIALCIGISLLLTAESLAQQNDREIVPLSEQDYDCMQNISCVIDSEELSEKGWYVRIDESIEEMPQERTARMTGKNIKVTAKYDKQGKLLKGTYLLKDVALPRALLSHLAGENYTGWNMTGNEVVIQDFNATTTEYHIKLTNGKDKKSVTFSQFDVINMKQAKAEGIANRNEEN